MYHPASPALCERLCTASQRLSCKLASLGIPDSDGSPYRLIRAFLIARGLPPADCPRLPAHLAHELLVFIEAVYATAPEPTPS